MFVSPLTCCSCRISSLRASTRFWSSRLSWDNKSVPSSAFSDSLVDSIACKLASKLCKLRCYGTGIRQNNSSEQPTDLRISIFYLCKYLLWLSLIIFSDFNYDVNQRGMQIYQSRQWNNNIKPVMTFNIILLYLRHKCLFRLLPLLLQHFHFWQNTVSRGFELSLLRLNLLHLVHQLVNFVINPYSGLRKIPS